MKTRSLFLITACLAALAANWPQWLGPRRDNVSKEKGLLQSWPKDGPKLLWTYTNAGEGYSCPSIAGGRMYLQGKRGDSEFVFALDLAGAKDGPPKEVWATKTGPAFPGTQWNAGPSATPAVNGEQVYALSGGGDLICVGAADGKECWRKNLPRDLGGEVNPVGGGINEPTPLGWGYAGSPLVDGEQLVVVPGGPKGTVAALNHKTGAVLWRSKDLTDQATYASPILVEVGGVRQYAVMTLQGVAGVAARDGRLLWYYKRKPVYSSFVIPTPIVHGDHVFVTVGHGGFSAGCDLLKLSADAGGTKAEKVYGNRNLANQQGGAVLIGEHIYGHSDPRGWTCLVFKTGDVAWSERGALGRGPVTGADGRLYCVSEDEGVVVLAGASPAGWKEHGRFKLPEQSKLRKPSGRVWTPPVIADGKLYLRDQQLLFCYDIKAK